MYLVACGLKKIRAGQGSSLLSAADLSNISACISSAPAASGALSVPISLPSEPSEATTSKDLKSEPLDTAGISVKLEEEGEGPEIGDNGAASEGEDVSGPPPSPSVSPPIPPPALVVITSDDDLARALLADADTPSGAGDSDGSSEGYSDTSEVEMFDVEVQTDPVDEDDEGDDTDDYDVPRAAPAPAADAPDAVPAVQPALLALNDAYTPTLPPHAAAFVAQQAAAADVAPPAVHLAPVPLPPVAPALDSHIDPYDADVDRWYVVWRGTRVGVFAHW